MNGMQSKNSVQTLQPTTRDLYHEFIQSVSTNTNTGKTYAAALLTFMDYLDANNLRNLNTVTPLDIQQYKNTLLGRGYSANTVNVKLSAVRAFFAWVEVIAPPFRSPASNVKGVKQDTEHKKSALTAEQVKTVLNTVDTRTVLGVRDYVMLLFMFSLGLRTCEICRLDKNDVEQIDGKFILHVWGKGKTGKSQVAVIPGGIMNGLKWYIERRGKDTEPELFRAKNGGRLNSQTLSHVVKRYFRAAGLDGEQYTAHSTRHTAITLAACKGVGLYDLQQFARHAKPETTEIYIHEIDAARSTVSATVYEQFAPTA